MSIRVIDVSYHNGVIDFARVKKAGIFGVIIRAGYGTKTEDKQFHANMTAAIKEGLHIGCYWFMYGSSNADALANAKKCIDTIKGCKGYIDLGVWSDWEYDSDKKAPGQTKETRTEFVRLFNGYIEEQGFEAGTYTNIDYYKNKFNMSKLKKWPVWIARYNKELGDYECAMWQYSSNGKIDGITGPVDLNYYYGQVSGNRFENYENYENKPNEGEYNMPTIRIGSTGKAVKVWQIIIGFTGDDVDGIFGKDTLNTTKSFQEKKGLTVDGIVGPKSWSAGLNDL